MQSIILGYASDEKMWFLFLVWCCTGWCPMRTHVVKHTGKLQAITAPTASQFTPNSSGVKFYIPAWLFLWWVCHACSVGTNVHLHKRACAHTHTHSKLTTDLPVLIHFTLLTLLNISIHQLNYYLRNSNTPTIPIHWFIYSHSTTISAAQTIWDQMSDSE
jgi:hypothetical protein